MVYLELFLGFLWVGCFSFGGAYAAIPLIRDVVLSHGWLTDETLSYMIAVSESTPGPIMVNLATYVGNQRAGILGSALATLAVILPAFVIILLITVVLKNFLKSHCMQSVLSVMKSCIIGIILATGTYMVINTCMPSRINGLSFDLCAITITAILAVLTIGSRIVLKKKMSPILIIAISAVLGIVIYAI